MNIEKIKKFLIVDFSKRLTLGDQLKIMFEILFVSWFLFTLVYIFAAVRGTGKTDTPSSAEVSQVQASEVSKEQPSVQTSEQSSEISEAESIPQTNGIFAETEMITAEHNEMYIGDMILVNKQYPCHSDGEEAVSLMGVKTDSYMVTDYNVSLNESITENLNDWLDDFAANYGESDIMIACGYRSRSNQEEIYNNEVDDVGEEEADKWVARPGYSEHQTGLVIDFTLYDDEEYGSIKYDGTDIYEWVNENCYKYGFILRYPEGKEEITGYGYEPWHFRYVGYPAAYYITQNNLTLEEYIELIKKYDINSPLLIDAGGEDKWYCYYIPANDGQTQLTVPKYVDYKVSGDNFSGFIITAKVEIKG